MTNLTFSDLGAFLAQAYLAYSFLVVLAPIAFGLHALLCVALLTLRKEIWRRRWLLWPVEVVYGFLNPLLYLLLLQPYFPHPHDLPSSEILNIVAFSVLFGIWGLRLFGGAASSSSIPRVRRLARALAAAAMVLVVVFAAKDLVWQSLRGFESFSGNQGIWAYLVPGLWYLGVSALYLIPGLLASMHFRAASSDDEWRENGQFLLTPHRSGRLITFSAVTLLLIAVAVPLYRPSEASLRQMLLDHRPAILEAGRKNHVDPALVASIVYVTQRSYTSPFSLQLEHAAMSGWLVDSTSNVLLSKRLDVSVGIAQIKPTTAMSALAIYGGAMDPSRWEVGKDPNRAFSAFRGGEAPYKERRDLPLLDSSWALPRRAVESLQPPFRTLVTKQQTVDALFRDQENIEFCALILALYAAHWEAADPGWSIRARPEILATLYQIGFERSYPKPNPLANEFGERVLKVYGREWIQRCFRVDESNL